MDPLSVIASSVAIIGAANSILHSIDKLKTLFRAPEAVAELIEDVQTLRALLLDAEEAQDLFNLVARKPALFSYLAQATLKLNELDKIINIKLLRSIGGGRPSSTQIRLRWLRNQPKVKALQADLRFINSSITTCFGVRIMTGQVRLQNSLQEIALATSQLSIDSHQLRDSICSRIDLHHGLSQLPKQIILQESTDNRPNENSVIENLGEGSVSTTTEIKDEHFVYLPGSHPQGTIGSKNYFDGNGFCSGRCACSCHPKLRTQTAQTLSYLTGSVCIRYIGGQTNRACDLSSCKRKRSITLNLTCYFPHWLLLKAISISLGFDPVGGINITTKMPCICPDTSKIFHLATAGDIKGMKTMFERDLASPNDVSYTFGYSLLHIAVDMEHIETIKFLLSQGANPYLTNRLNLTAVDLSWNRILSKRTDILKSDEISNLFGITSQADQIESRRLSRLQQIVLGLIDVDLDVALKSSSISEINAKDADGNTVLAWAAHCANEYATRSLLRYGAEYNHASRFGSTALHYAVSARASHCILPLLEAGANPDTYNTCLYETPLHVAALRHDKPEEFMAPLISYGADVNACDYEGSSVLAFAAQSNHCRSASYLLAHGANIDAPDKSGLTPIGTAVIYKHHAMLAMLLEQRATITHKTNSGETLLHLCAQYGDLETIAILAQTSVKISGGIVDTQGRRAIDYARLRDNEEFANAFEKICI